MSLGTRDRVTSSIGTVPSITGGLEIGGLNVAEDGDTGITSVDHFSILAYVHELARMMEL